MFGKPRIPYRVRGISSNAGNGNITISPAVSSLYRTLSDHYGTGVTNIGYILVGPDANKFFEVGVGLFDGTTNVLVRDYDDKIMVSSNSNLRVNIPASVTYDVLALDVGQHYVHTFTTTLVLDQNDHGGNFVFLGSSPASITLCALVKAPMGCTYVVKNDGTANLTLQTGAGDSFAWLTNPNVILPGDGLIIYRGPSVWHVLPFKSSPSVYYWNGSSMVGRNNFTIWRSSTAPVSVPDGDIWIQP